MQTNALTSGSEILFHPPGCNPFYVPPLPSNNYHPSNPQYQPTDVKAIALTPEKKRNFHLKDNTSYTPLNYSFCNDNEENVDVNIPEKPSEQVKQHWLPNLPPTKKQATISTTRIPIPKSTPSIHIGFSDTDSHHKSKTSQNITSNSRAPSRNSQPISDSSISAPVPKMTSTQNSKGKVSPNISMLVKRFRHGKPQPPSARKLSNTSSTPSSDKSKYEWLSTTNQSSQSISAAAESSSLDEINDVFDSSLAELQSQVDHILKQSETPQPLPTPVPTPIFTPEIPSFTPTPPMLQPMENISSTKPPYMVPSFIYKPQSPQKVPVAKQPEEPFPPRIPVQDDILQQWRLKRKMEMARATSTTSRDHFRSSCHREAPPSCSIRPSDNVNYPAAEKPYTPSCSPRKAEPKQGLEPRKCTKSVGVSVVPTSCAETQTTPKSSNENSVVSINDFRTDSSVSMHRVTVVDGATGSHDLSPLSSKVTTRSDPDTFDEGSTHSRSNQRNMKGRVEKLKKKSGLPHSPTTSVVKQVIGAHLFDAATDVSTPGRTDRSSDVYFDSSMSDHISDDQSSSSSHHISSTPLPNSQIPPDPLHNLPSSDAASTASGPSKKEDTIQSSSEVEDPQDILDSILDSIRDEPGVFPDDPVLTSLRQQRQKYLDELASIDDQLSRLQ
ncbi:uncharacterized protein LOC100186598 [Ciona intestinalis]